MKILHTSDLHLGKNLMEESFYEDQKYILNEILDVIKKENIDVLLISGDVYDKSIPSVEAVNLFDEFLNELLILNKHVLIISGNHDSNDRLGYGSDIFKKVNIHIVSKFKGFIEKININDVDFYLLPFIRPFYLKNYLTVEEYEKVNNNNEVMKYLLNNIKLDKSKKNVLLLHQFVTYNGLVSTTDSETSVLGTLDAIDVNLLEDFDYVALGHVHRPQKIKNNNIRYSGSPLAYSFSEVNDNKSVVIYDSNDDSIKLIPLIPKRKLTVLKGNFDTIMNLNSSNDIIKVILTDDIVLSPMEEIKKRFPNAISLEFNKKEAISDFDLIDIKSPKELFESFFKEQNNRELNADELKYLDKMMEE